MEENSIQRRVWTPKEKDAVHESTTQMNGQSRCTIYELLPEKRMLSLDYALTYPNPRHRELAYRMLDG